MPEKNVNAYEYKVAFGLDSSYAYMKFLLSKIHLFLFFWAIIKVLMIFRSFSLILWKEDIIATTSVNTVTEEIFQDCQKKRQNFGKASFGRLTMAG